MHRRPAISCMQAGGVTQSNTTILTMLKFISFASGSSGNCYYLNCDGYGLLIDMGIGIRLFKRNFNSYGLSIAQAKALLLTHDHTDHVKAAGVVSQTFNVPVYTSLAVHHSIDRNHFVSKKIPAKLQHVIEKGQTINLGPFEITTFDVPHDSADNNGYIIRVEGKCFVLLTDVGHFTDEMATIVHEATHLVVEANYDAEMLRTGRYPLRLKERIRNGHGHSSNAETAHFLAAHLNPARIRRIWLCHLSAENNLPRLAHDTIAQALNEAGLDLTSADGCRLDVLARKTPSLLMEL